MQKWSHMVWDANMSGSVKKVIGAGSDRDSYNGKAFDAALQGAGANGWELVSTLSDGSSEVQLFFKRTADV